MKRAITVIIIFVMSLAICIFGDLFESFSYNEMRDHAYEIGNHITENNKEKAYEKATELKDTWQKREAVMRFFVHRDKLEEDTEKIDVLPDLIDADLLEEAHATAIRIYNNN